MLAANRRIVAQVLEDRTEQLLDLWLELGAAGPTCSSPEVGTNQQAREHFLRPLARMLIGGLRGSAAHAAVYLDERLRYVDSALDIESRAHSLDPVMLSEFDGIARLVVRDGGSPGRAVVVQVLEELHTPILAPGEPSQRVLFIGDCLFLETRAFLTPRAAAARRALDVRQLFFSARQPLDAVNGAIVNEVSRFRPDVIGISLFTYEGVPPFAAAWQRAASPLAGRRPTGLVEGLVGLLHETIADIRTASDSSIAVHLPAGLPLDRVRRRVRVLPAHSGGQRRFLRELRAGIRELVLNTENTMLIDEQACVEETGGLRAAAAPVFQPSDVPPGYSHISRLGPALAQDYDGLLADHAMLSRAKVVLVDLDNTLWQGVMAEGPVVHDVDGQRLLKELKDSGVLLVALSKNDPASIRWSELVLRPDDFVLQMVNWQSKPDNVSYAVQNLDLAPDTFVLLDDNPVERALVTEQVPGVRALDPARPETWRALRRWLDMPSTTQTDEAKRRTQMYREAADRRATTTQSHDYPTMMRSLALEHAVRPARQTDMSRILELVHRTNQFNTTTRRRSADELEALLRDDGHGVYVASLKDRFGDLGVVALAIFARDERCFDSVIMSCRAMGFGLELALLAEVLSLESSGVVRAKFVPTQRNSPAADLFLRAGFQEVAEGQWELDGDPPCVPEWFRS